MHGSVLFRKPIRIPFDPTDRFLVFLKDMAPTVGPPGAVMFNRGFQIGLDFRKCKDRFALHFDRSLFIISAWGTGTLFPVL